MSADRISIGVSTIEAIAINSLCPLEDIIKCVFDLDKNDFGHSELTYIYGGGKIYGDAICPTTGASIYTAPRMEALLLCKIESTDPGAVGRMGLHLPIERLVADIRDTAIESGIPYVRDLFKMVQRLLVIMPIRVDLNENDDQRTDTADGISIERLHEHTREVSEGSDNGIDSVRCAAGSDSGSSPSEIPAGTNGIDSLSRKELASELAEHRKDLRAFSTSYEIIRQRVSELKEDGRRMKLLEWSGTAAVMGTLEMSIHSIERVIAELQGLIKSVDSGVIRNTDGD